MSVGIIAFLTVVLPGAVFLYWLMGAKGRRFERERWTRPVLNDEPFYVAVIVHRLRARVAAGGCSRRL